MRDNQELMMRFSKIVERHPEIYDQNLDAYKTRQVDVAWEKVAHSVRNELKEECTVEELKIKWKGIRSSFNRYKNKLLNPNESSSCKKYYLYDTLKFLDPFTRPKGADYFRPQNANGSLFEECSGYEDESKESQGNISSDDCSTSEIKPDISNSKQIKLDPLVSPRIANVTSSEYTTYYLKRKHSSEEKGIDEDNEDLQFFKSILPDIRDFTNKEKRKLKMGILRLIDDLETERKQQ